MRHIVLLILCVAGWKLISHDSNTVFRYVVFCTIVAYLWFANPAARRRRTDQAARPGRAERDAIPMIELAPRRRKVARRRSMWAAPTPLEEMARRSEEERKADFDDDQSRRLVLHVLYPDDFPP